MRAIMRFRYVLFFIILPIMAFSIEGNHYRGITNSIRFSNNEVSIYELNLNTLEHTQLDVDYEVIYENKVPFLLLGEPVNEEWLFLYSKHFSIIYKDSENSFFATIGHAIEFNNVRNAACEATSFLTEGDKKYEPANLRSNEPDAPWIEGVAGDGVGEKIFLTWQTWSERDGSRGGMGALIISNGYVSYEKPYLYETNNRVRKIRVTDSDGAFSFITELEDTPNPQVVFLPSVPEKMEIEILSVYKGTTWDDTCINFIEGLEMSQAIKLKEAMEGGESK
jgi:hypothetical protein